MRSNYNNDLGEIGEKYFDKTIRHWISSAVSIRNNKVYPDITGIDLFSTISEFEGHYSRIEWQIKIRTSIKIGTSGLFGKDEKTYNVRLGESELKSLKILCCSENDSFLVLGVPRESCNPKEIYLLDNHSSVDLNLFNWYAIDLKQIKSYIWGAKGKSLSIPIPVRNLLNLASFSLLISSLKVNYYTKKKSLGIISYLKNGGSKDFLINDLLESGDFNKITKFFENIEGDHYSSNQIMSKFVLGNLYSVLAFRRILGESANLNGYSVYTHETLGEEVYFWLFFKPFFLFMKYYNLDNNSRRAFPIDEKEIEHKSLCYRTILYFIIKLQKKYNVFSMYTNLNPDLPENVTANFNGSVFKFDYRKESIKKTLLSRKRENLFNKDKINKEKVDYVMSKPFIHNNMDDREILEKLNLADYKNEIFLSNLPPKCLFPSEISNVFIRYPIELFS